MPRRNVFPVWFNNSHKEMYTELKDKNIVSQPFNDFVRTAFFEKINEAKIRFVNLSKEHIEKITFERMKDLSVQSKLK